MNPTQPTEPTRSPGDAAGQGAVALPLRPHWQRALWLATGVLSLATGIVGIFVPVLPTTPFVLLAAFCYSRASLRLHAMLVGHRLFGPLIREWHESHSIPPRAKIAGLTLMAMSFASSIYVVRDRPWLQLFLLALGVGFATWLARIPSRRSSDSASRQERVLPPE